MASCRSTHWPITATRAPSRAKIVAEADQPGVRMARIAVRPSWVGVLDFQSRLPGPLAGKD